MNKTLEIDSMDGHRFGFGTIENRYLTGQGFSYGLPNFGNKGERERHAIKRAAWSNGDPRPDMNGYRRYTDINTRFRTIIRTLTEIENTSLAEALLEVKPRLADEGVEVTQDMIVPSNYGIVRAPMRGLVGFALPRVALEFQAGNNQDEGYEATVESVKAIRELGRRTESPEVFLAMLAERAVRFGIHPDRLLPYAYSNRLLQEQRIKTDFMNIVPVYQEFAPKLWAGYEELEESGRAKLGIAELPL